VLVGLSMGVNLVLEYARRWPAEVADLVGLGFPYFATATEAREGVKQDPWIRLMLEAPRLAGALIPPTWWLGRSLPGLSGLFSSIYTPAMARDALRVRYHAFASSLWHCMIDNALDPLLASGAEKTRLFVHGGEDKWCSADDVAGVVRRFPASRLAVIEGAQHNLVVTQPERTVALILEHTHH